MGMGGVLQGCEDLVLLETLREMLGRLCVQFVVLETANESQIKASGRADSREGSNWQRT